MDPEQKQASPPTIVKAAVAFIHSLQCLAFLMAPLVTTLGFEVHLHTDVSVAPISILTAGSVAS